MTLNLTEHRARVELRDKIKSLISDHYDENLYSGRTRKAVCKEIAEIRDALIERYKVSVPIVALYVGDYGRLLKCKLLAPTLLKGDGCVGFCKEPEGGGIAELKVENRGGPRN